MKRIIIIGASSGLGERIATDFAGAGWYVGIAARRIDRLNEIKRTHPDNIEACAIDVTAADAVIRFKELIQLCGGMDVLLYASGVGFQDPDLDDDRLEATLQTNAVGFARITTAAYKHFRDTGTAGHIAAITSVAGTKGIGVAAAYSSTKRFQQTFIDSLEQLARSQNVKVRFTDIRPGFVRTAILDTGKNYPMLMTVDYAAPLIEKAILRRKRVATIDSRWRVLTALWRMLPQWIWKRINLTTLSK